MHLENASASWLVPVAAKIAKAPPVQVPAFYDLFYGMPGEIIFLSTLAAETGQDRYREIAQRPLSYLRQRLRQSSSSIRPLGLYAGWGSIFYMLRYLALLESDVLYFDEIEEWLGRPDMDELIAVDGSLSLLKGAAGLMAVTADVHGDIGSRRAGELARKAADHLASKRQSGGWSGASGRPLSGLAHGASGYALAFAKLFRATREERFYEQCLLAVEDERALFEPSQRNCRDMRRIVTDRQGEKPHCSTAWSHGAPGIGIARKAIMACGIVSDQIVFDYEIALETTLKRGFDGNDTVVFGCFGNADLIASASDGDKATVSERGSIVRRLLSRVETNALELGNGLADVPGFFSGTTGIAFQCLRMAAPGSGVHPQGETRKIADSLLSSMPPFQCRRIVSHGLV